MAVVNQPWPVKTRFGDTSYSPPDSIQKIGFSWPWIMLVCRAPYTSPQGSGVRSEEHTSELQSRPHLVCRLLLEKKKVDMEITTDDVHLLTYKRARQMAEARV